MQRSIAWSDPTDPTRVAPLDCAFWLIHTVESRGAERRRYMSANFADTHRLCGDALQYLQFCHAILEPPGPFALKLVIQQISKVLAQVALLSG